MAAGLLALGIQPEQRVAIASATRIEWLYADLAIMCAGRGDDRRLPLDRRRRTSPSSSSDSGTRIVFAEDDAQIAKLRAQRDHLPDLIRVVTFDGEADGEWVLSLADLQALGAKHLVEHPTAVDEAVAAVQPEHLATLIYTSGTTGPAQGRGAAAPVLDLHRRRRRGHRDPAPRTTCSTCGCRCRTPSARCSRRCSCRSASRRRSTAASTRSSRTSRWSGPRSWPVRRGSSRRCTRRSCRPSQEEGGIKLRLFSWAFGVGGQVSRARLEGRRPDPLLQAQHALADRLVLSKIRARLGGRIRFLVSGSAALSTDIAAWFHAAGLVVLEGYALTETGGGACIGDPEHPMFGVVGPAAGRLRDQDRRRRRDPHPRPAGDARLPQPARGDGRGAERRRLVRHRRRRRDRRRRAGCGSRTARRT